jgi:hypothetical protein
MSKPKSYAYETMGRLNMKVKRCHLWWIIVDTIKRFFFGKLTYVLKEEDTSIIRGIPQIYNDNRNIKQQMATG